MWKWNWIALTGCFGKVWKMLGFRSSTHSSPGILVAPVDGMKTNILAQQATSKQLSLGNFYIIALYRAHSSVYTFSVHYYYEFVVLLLL
jgi:hypothetical protein